MPRKKRTDTELAYEYLKALLKDESAAHALRLEAARLLLNAPRAIDYSLLTSEMAEMAN